MRGRAGVAEVAPDFVGAGVAEVAPDFVGTAAAVEVDGFAGGAVCADAPSTSRSNAASSPSGRMLIALPPDQGVEGGGTRRFVACSKAYPSSIRRPSLQAIPVNVTPKGAGRGT